MQQHTATKDWLASQGCQIVEGFTYCFQAFFSQQTGQNNHATSQHLTFELHRPISSGSDRGELSGTRLSYRLHSHGGWERRGPTELPRKQRGYRQFGQLRDAFAQNQAGLQGTGTPQRAKGESRTLGLGDREPGTRPEAATEIPALCLPALTERLGLEGCAREGSKMLGVS